jgi:hypothetical protein
MHAVLETYMARNCLKFIYHSQRIGVSQPCAILTSVFDAVSILSSINANSCSTLLYLVPLNLTGPTGGVVYTAGMCEKGTEGAITIVRAAITYVCVYVYI